MSRRALGCAWLACLAAIVYGSLLPFEVRRLSLHEAWAAFVRLPYLSIGIERRADLLANLVLYAPFGFLTAGVISERVARGSVARWPAAWLACAAVGGVVEFLQVFFPPRTVSWNDVLAEAIGAALGIALWVAGRDVWAALARALSLGGRGAFRAALLAYAGFYALMSLFPYDFLLSAANLEWKIASGAYAPLLVVKACGDWTRCAAKLAAETAAVVPLGVLLATETMPGRPIGLARATTIGLLGGLVLEFLQFFLASGVSQGLSVLSRAMGAGMGVAAARLGPRGLALAWPYRRSFVGLGAPAYAAGLVVLGGWTLSGWLGLAEGLGRLGRLRFAPFYYHYYTAETVALASALAQVGMYVPLGLGYWAWSARADGSSAGRAWVSGGLGALTALVVEAGKLFAPARRPDPTNVLLGAVAAAGAFAAATVAQRWLRERGC